MESKNIKIVDEHGIDRVANVIFSIDISGSDYIVYAIERDSENDNIFVSKLIKNIDGTSNMMNIEDSMEKDTVSSTVKQLTLDAVNSKDDVLPSTEVTLSDGKIVKFITSLINKEQSINVQKTYIATVKKTVTKVSMDYYNIKVEPIVSEINSVVSEPVNIFPIEDDKPVSVEPSVSVKEEVVPVVENVEVKIPSQEVLQSNFSVEPVSSVSELKIEPIIPTVLEPVPEVVEEKVSIVSEPANSAVILPTEDNKNLLDLDTQKPSVEEKKVGGNKLVFDASKESNLNSVLGEISYDNAIPVENVEPVREFGVEDSEVNVSSEPVNLTSKSKAGFANNKFFMVIAIGFFVAACIFLGYEAFRFFKLSK